MTGDVAARFQAGAGVAPDTLRVAITSVAGAVAILWAAWTVFDLYRCWVDRRIELLDLVIGSVRAVVLVLLSLWVFV